jgi:predicted Na+-dependent transporter
MAAMRTSHILIVLAGGDARYSVCNASTKTFLATPTLARLTAGADYHRGNFFCREAPAVWVNVRATILT